MNELRIKGHYMYLRWARRAQENANMWLALAKSATLKEIKLTAMKRYHESTADVKKYGAKANALAF
jgi:hypothetical protein